MRSCESRGARWRVAASVASGLVGMVTHAFLAADHRWSVPVSTWVTMKPWEPWPSRCDGISSTVVPSVPSSITVRSPSTVHAKLAAALWRPARFSATAVTS